MKEIGKSNTGSFICRDRNSVSKRAFIPKDHARDYSKLYLICISIPQPRLGMRIPKLLAKNIRIKFHRVLDHDYYDHHTNQTITTTQDNDSNKKKSVVKNWTKKLLPKKGASILSKFFGSIKKTTPPPPSQPSSDFCSLLVDYDEGEVGRQSTGVLPPLAYYFNKDKTVGNNGDNNAKNNNGGLMMIGRQGSPRHLVRVPSLRKSTSTTTSSTCTTSRRKLRIAIYVRKMGNNSSSDRDNGQELCKKRILMGGRCKPLNLSGTIHYDHNGIILPESIGD